MRLTKKQFTLILTLLVMLVSLFTNQNKVSFKAAVNPPPTHTENKTSVTVTRVVDGDTVVLSTGEKVRYIGMNTPERDECYFAEAKETNERLVLGKEVALVKDVSETDRYGRLLRYVYMGKTLVNEKLVAEGYAYAATYPPDVAKKDLFLAAEQKARTEEKGLWNKENCH